VREYGSRYAVRTAVAVELIGLARDHNGPDATVRYIDSLPKALQQHPSVIEQKQIALAKLGDVSGAAAALENLIRHVGPSSDRCGILGGRYKQLMRASRTPRDRRHYLELAIAAYERGTAEDLNDYYLSSNLPRLYRRRADPGDEERAAEAASCWVWS
jgi:tetratricopeptide repeat protein